MKYRENKMNGEQLSALGFGCMRFPKDLAETEKLILHAIKNGVNFFDTAYIYPRSEEILGGILHKNNKRRDVKISTKIMPAAIKKYDDFDKYFNRQLTRLSTDYVDYYLIHNITDAAIWKRLVGLGAPRWIAEKKAQGKIKNIGFSYHGGKEEFIKICDAYDWEFCMLQYNYLDENHQAGRSGLNYAASKGWPVIAMEPLRGGILANKLPKDAAAVFAGAHVNRSHAEWSLRWLWDQPEVSVVLSGMSKMDDLTENIAVANAADVDSFTEEDRKLVAKAKAAVEAAIKTPCTACGYCMPCPRGVDIPTCLSCYNNIVIEGKLRAITTYIMQTSFKSKPQVASLCNGCNLCSPKCPQNIDIPRELRNTKRALEKPYLKPILSIARRVMRL